jgi:hypothetical protein
MTLNELLSGDAVWEDDLDAYGLEPECWNQ